MTEQKQLVGKLVKVMQQVKYIEKKGFNNFNKYKYATEADVNEKVREYLAEQNVMMIPDAKSYNVREHTNRKGNLEYIGTAEVEFTFHDGDTGETISFTVFGEGQDAGDKSVYKAITGAQKYALMKSFMIPTGDDPERDREGENDSQGNKGKQPNKNKQHRNEQQITSGTVGAIKTKWLEKGQKEADLDTWIKKTFKRNLPDITEREGLEILQLFEKKESA